MVNVSISAVGRQAPPHADLTPRRYNPPMPPDPLLDEKRFLKPFLCPAAVTGKIDVRGEVAQT